jgi:hypothetical protein
MMEMGDRKCCLMAERAARFTGPSQGQPRSCTLSALVNGIGQVDKILELVQPSGQCYGAREQYHTTCLGRCYYPWLASQTFHCGRRYSTFRLHSSPVHSLVLHHIDSLQIATAFYLATIVLSRENVLGHAVEREFTNYQCLSMAGIYRIEY